MENSLTTIQNQEQKDANRTLAEQNAQLIVMANNMKRQKWLYNALECNRYYEDDQLTAKEFKELEAAGMPTFTINMILPTVEIERYFLTSRPPKWTTSGRDGNDSSIADIHLKLSDYCFDVSNGKLTNGQVVLSSIVKGIGYYHIRVDKNMDRGLGEVLYDWVNMEDVIVDPSSRDIFFRDAGFIGIAKNMSKSILKLNLPEYADKIDAATGAPLCTVYDPNHKAEDLQTYAIKPIDGEFDDIIPYYEIYRKVKKRFHHVTMKKILSPEQKDEIVTNATVMLEEYKIEQQIKLQELEKQLKDKFQAGEMIESRLAFELSKAQRQIKEEVQKKSEIIQSQVSDMLYPIETLDILDEEYNKFMENKEFASSVVDERPYHEARVEVTVSVGDDAFLYRVKTNYKEYTIIPLPFMWVGNTLPLSAVKPLIGKQDEINKSHQIMLHHASMSTSGQWLIPSGAITDEKEWDANITLPGGHLEYNVIEGQKPERLSPEPLNNAFFTITQQGREDFQYISGVWVHMMGGVVSKEEPYKLAMARDQFSTRRLQTWVTNVYEPCLRYLGNVFKMVAQDTYTTYKVWRITSPTAGKDEQDKEYKINVPIWNDNGDIVSKWNDYETAKFDVMEVEGSTLPLNKQAKEEKYHEYYKENLIDDIAMIKETDIPDKDGILARKSLYMQLKQQVDSSTEEIKSLNGDNETLRRQVIQGNIALQSLRGELETRKDVLETEAQQKNLRTQMKNELDSFRDKLTNQMTKVADRLAALEKEKQNEKKVDKSNAKK